METLFLHSEREAFCLKKPTKFTRCFNKLFHNHTWMSSFKFLFTAVQRKSVASCAFLTFKSNFRTQQEII